MHSSVSTTGWRTTSITWPTKCLLRGADPTTWTTSPKSSASIQPWTGAPHLPYIAIMSYVTRRLPILHICSAAAHNTLACSAHSTMDNVSRSFVVLCAPQAATLMDYHTTSESKSQKFCQTAINLHFCIHTDDKSYRCATCQKSFADRGYFM